MWADTGVDHMHYTLAHSSSVRVLFVFLIVFLLLSVLFIPILSAKNPNTDSSSKSNPPVPSKKPSDVANDMAKDATSSNPESDNKDSSSNKVIPDKNNENNANHENNKAPINNNNEKNISQPASVPDHVKNNSQQTSDKQKTKVLVSTTVLEQSNSIKNTNRNHYTISSIGNISSDMVITVDTSWNNNGNHVIKQVDFIPSKNNNNVRLEVADLESEPENITQQLPMNTNAHLYRYLDVKLLSNEEYIGETGIESMSFVFSIEKTWLQNNSIDKHTVQMLRYHNNSWNELNTTYYFETGSEVYYQAETPGLSIFAVVGDQAAHHVDSAAITNASNPSILFLICFVNSIILLAVSIIKKDKFGLLK